MARDDSDPDLNLDPDPGPDPDRPEAKRAASSADNAAGEPTRVARVRYVRSGWGVLFGLGFVGGLVVLGTGVAEFDTDPLCEVIAEAAATSATVPTTTAPTSTAGGTEPPPSTTAPPADNVVALPTDTASAQAELDQIRSLEGLLPHHLEDELAVLIAQKQRRLDAIEALGPEPSAEEVSAAIAEADGNEDERFEAIEAALEVDTYAAESCGLIEPG